jgi:hypothetical protein
LKQLSNEISINLHHDAITGTCTDYVAVDYRERLRRGKSDLLDNIIIFMSYYFSKETGYNDIT